MPLRGTIVRVPPKPKGFTAAALLGATGVVALAFAAPASVAAVPRHGPAVAAAPAGVSPAAAPAELVSLRMEGDPRASARAVQASRRAAQHAAVRPPGRPAAAAAKTPGPPAPRPAATPPRPAAAARPVPPAGTGDPRSIARAMLAGYGWDGGQFGCLDSLWTKESGWQVQAANASGAYGIPQSLPGKKMASAGADWRTDPATQIRWGLTYIKAVYGSPCGAWAHSQATNWY